MLAMSSIIYFLLFGTFYSYGVWLPRVMEEFNCNQEQAAWVGSIASGLLVLLDLPSDLACYHFGVFAMSIVGSILCGVGIIVSSYLQNIYHLYLSFGVLLGIGSALLYTPTLVMVGRWFDRYQAPATTLMMIGAPIGSLIFNPLMEKIMENYSLRDVMNVYGIMFLAITFICSFGYMPFSPMFIEKYETLEEDTNGTEAKEEVTEIESGFEFRASLFKNKSYLLFCACRFFAIFAYYVPLFHLIKYAISLGISGSTASLMLTAWSASNLFGRLAFGSFISRYRDKVLITYQIAMFLSGVVSIGAYFADNTWSLFLYCCIYGMLDGSNIGLASLVTIDLTSPLDLGAAWGIQQTINGIPTIAGPVLIGAMNDAKVLSANYMFVFTGGTFILGSIFMNFARVLRNREKYVVEDKTPFDEEVTELAEIRPRAAASIIPRKASTAFGPKKISGEMRRKTAAGIVTVKQGGRPKRLSLPDQDTDMKSSEFQRPMKMRSQTVMTPKTEYSFENQSYSSDCQDEVENKHRTFSIKEEIEDPENVEEELSQSEAKTME